MKPRIHKLSNKLAAVHESHMTSPPLVYNLAHYRGNTSEGGAPEVGTIYAKHVYLHVCLTVCGFWISFNDPGEV